MREFRLFELHDRAENSAYHVTAIHDERGYRGMRSALARQYDVGVTEPNIQVTGADLKGDRALQLTHLMHRGVPLHQPTRELVCAHVELLWGHEVVLEERDADN
jgi:spore cortex formation protein SpoVR/YcgB (stage V sporulation)